MKRNWTIAAQKYARKCRWQRDPTHVFDRRHPARNMAECIDRMRSEGIPDAAWMEPHVISARRELGIYVYGD